MSSWYYYNFKKTPIAVENGYKTKNTRGAFAKSWFSKRWLKGILDSSDKTRMGRGRSYIRKGQITDIKIRLGEIKGKVQGTSKTPYGISIKFSLWKKTQWKNLISDIIVKPDIYASIINEEFPLDIESCLVNNQFFFASLKELKYNCSCPDWGKPCKHVAALIYALIELIDEDPFIMFLLRGNQKQMFVDILKDAYSKSVFDQIKDTKKSNELTKTDYNLNKTTANHHFQKISNFMMQEISSNESSSTIQSDRDFSNFFHSHQTSVKTTDNLTIANGAIAQNSARDGIINPWIGNLGKEMEQTGNLVNLLVGHIKMALNDPDHFDELIRIRNIFYTNNSSFYDSLLGKRATKKIVDAQPKIELSSSVAGSTTEDKTKQIKSQKQNAKKSKVEILSELKQISGLGPTMAQSLYELGVRSLEDLAYNADKFNDGFVIPKRTLLIYRNEAKSLLNLDTNDPQIANDEMEKKRIIEVLSSVKGISKKFAKVLYGQKIRKLEDIAVLSTSEFYNRLRSGPSIAHIDHKAIIEKSFLKIISKTRSKKNDKDKTLYNRLLRSDHELTRLHGVGTITMKRFRANGVKNLLDLALLSEDNIASHVYEIPITTLRRLQIAARSHIVQLSTSEEI